MPSPEIFKNMTDDQIIDYMSHQFSSSISNMDQATTWRDMAKAVLDGRNAEKMIRLTQKVEVLTWVLIILTFVLVVLGVNAWRKERRIFRKKRKNMENN